MKAFREQLDSFEKIIERSNYLEDAPFKYPSINIRLGLKYEETPHFLGINKTYGDLGLGIEVNVNDIVKYDDNNLKRVFQVTILRCLIAAGKKYDRPIDIFVKLLANLDQSEWGKNGRGKIISVLEDVAGNSGPNDLISYLENPPPRLPNSTILELSRWYRQLSDPDKSMILKLLQVATDGAIRDVLSIIDGVRVFENEDEKTKFLIVAKKGTKETIINDSIILNDIYRSVVSSYAAANPAAATSKNGGSILRCFKPKKKKVEVAGKGVRRILSKSLNMLIQNRVKSAKPKIPGVVKSRINIQKGNEKKGLLHTLKEHFSGKSNKSQFSINQKEWRTIIQSKPYIQSPVRQLGTGVNSRYARTMDVGRNIGKSAATRGGTIESRITTITDKSGNLLTSFPGGLP
ncbi:hypothetical protein GQR58_027419 [Nymphon striatum]|nr:hypothetical protein GQR58_027419 [Nymphon striatum]